MDSCSDGHSFMAPEVSVIMGVGCTRYNQINYQITNLTLPLFSVFQLLPESLWAAVQFSFCAVKRNVNNYVLLCKMFFFIMSKLLPAPGPKEGRWPNVLICEISNITVKNRCAGEWSQTVVKTPHSPVSSQSPRPPNKITKDAFLQDKSQSEVKHPQTPTGKRYSKTKQYKELWILHLFTGVCEYFTSDWGRHCRNASRLSCLFIQWSWWTRNSTLPSHLIKWFGKEPNAKFVVCCVKQHWAVCNQLSCDKALPLQCKALRHQVTVMLTTRKDQHLYKSVMRCQSVWYLKRNC